MITYESLKQWLSKPTQDQNLETLTDITLTKQTGRKRWFASREIKPVYTVGYYDSDNEEIVLGDKRTDAITISTSAVSAATTDFVITSGEVWEIYSVGVINYSSPSYGNISYYDGTNVYPLMSGPMWGSAAAGVFINSGQGTFPIRIEGDGTAAIRCVLTTFAGGNTVRAMLMYRRVA